MTEQPSLPPSETPPTDEAESKQEKISPFRLISGFFLIPVLMVVIGVVCFLIYSALTQQEKTVSELLETVASGRGVNKPWQAAFELSRRLSESPESARDPEFLTKLLEVFEHASAGDPRVRCYLAIALANTKDARALQSLRSVLKDSSSEIRIHAIIAIGLFGDAAAAPEVASFAEAADPGERKAAICALGMLKNPESVELLKKALADPSDEIQWNAAVALASLGDSSAVPVLLKMIDRRYLSQFAASQAKTSQPQHTAFGRWGRSWPFGSPVPGFDESQQIRVIQQALSSLAKLNTTGALPQVKVLLQDPSDEVKWHAALALAELSDSSAVPILESRLDRRGLLRKGYGYDASTELMKAALHALGKLRSTSSAPAVSKLKEEDPSAEIRALAEEVLANLAGS